MDIFDTVILCAFCLGMLAGSTTVGLLWLCCRRTTKMEVQFKKVENRKIPNEVFVTRFGRCFHTNKKCRQMENATAMKYCQHCLKDDAAQLHED